MNFPSQRAIGGGSDSGSSSVQTGVVVRTAASRLMFNDTQQTADSGAQGGTTNDGGETGYSPEVRQ